MIYKINENKTVLFVTELETCGYFISIDEIKPTDKRIKAFNRNQSSKTKINCKVRLLRSIFTAIR